MPSKRRCVIKVLHPASDNPPELQEVISKRFEREAAVLETLGEAIDQIPRLYAYFEEEGEYYLVQELIEGQTLGEKTLKDGPMSEAACREFLASFLCLLDRVHSQGIIHRDIKPNNVIIRARDGRPVLIDFGIVKEAVRLSLDKTGNTRTVSFGTPGYAPYEQARGTPVFASDLYSLGVTTIYILAGKSPTEMIDPKSGDIHWRGHVSSVSHEFAALLNKSIEPNYRDRYRTARDMLDAVNSLALIESPKQIPHQDQAAGKIAKVSDDSSTVAIAQENNERAARLLQEQKRTEEIIEPNQGQPSVGISQGLRPPYPPTIPYEQQSQDQQGWAFTEVLPTINPVPDKLVKRRVGWLLIGIGIIGIGVLLIVFVFNLIPGSTPDNEKPSETVKTTDGGTKPPEVTASPAVEAVRYYLEMKDGNKRMTEFEPLDFSKSFRFHFVPPKRGYLYLIGPGANDTPTIFLTSKPIPATGMTTNKIEAGANFQFPKTWIRIDTGANLATYTVIFSSEPLRLPAFLTSSSMQELTAADLQQVETMSTRIEAESGSDHSIVKIPASMKGVETMSTRIEAEPGSNRSTVKIPAAIKDDKDKPLVFDIRIRRK